MDQAPSGDFSSSGRSSVTSLPPGTPEWVLLAVLAAIQFCHIMDFTIMMPLGPALMRTFHIGPSEFSLIVSSYTFSAAVFGLLLALFIDRFDRKRALLTLYTGFAVSTLFCAMA